MFTEPTVYRPTFQSVNEIRERFISIGDKEYNDPSEHSTSLKYLISNLVELHQLTEHHDSPSFTQFNKLVSDIGYDNYALQLFKALPVGIYDNELTGIGDAIPIRVLMANLFYLNTTSEDVIRSKLYAVKRNYRFRIKNIVLLLRDL